MMKILWAPLMPGMTKTSSFKLQEFADFFEALLYLIGT